MKTISVCLTLLLLTSAWPAQADLFDDAVTADEKGDKKRAFKLYKKSADKEGYLSAIYNVGNYYLRGIGVKKDYGEAREWLERAAKQEHLPSITTLGILYANEEGPYRDFAKAREYYSKAAARWHPKALGLLGDMHKAGTGVPKDFLEAAMWRRLGAELGHAVSQFNLGAQYANGDGVPEDPEEAARWFRMASENGDDDAKALLKDMESRSTPPLPAEFDEASLRHLATGKKLVAAGRFREALDQLTRSVCLNPRSAEARKERAMVFGALALSSQAAQEAQAALGLGAESIDLRRLRAVARFGSGNYTGAVEDYDAVIKRGASPGAHLGRALARAALARYVEAIADYDAVLKLEPKLAEAHAYRGLARHHMGDTPGGLKDLDMAIYLSPNNGDFHFHKAVILLKTGDLNAANGELAQAVNLEDYDNAEAYYLKGLVQLQRGPDYYIDAAVHLDRAVKKYPNNAAIRKLQVVASQRSQAQADAVIERTRGGASFSFSGVSRAIIGGISASPGSDGSSYQAGGYGSGGAGSSSSPDYSAQNQARQGLSQDAANRNSIEKKLWDMNNPYKRR